MADMQRRPTAYGARPRPVGGSGLELASWLFMRVSGIVLWVLVLGHIYVVHIANDVANIDYEFVAKRWASPFWRVWDEAMLILALVHGVNGLRVIIDDYVRNRGWRLAWSMALYVVAFLLAIVGSVVLLTFQPKLG